MRVAAVFAHPDDEAFAAGGLLARCALRGPVELIVATRGEAGAARDRDPSPLGARRQAELEASCHALGLDPPRQLGLPDGALTPGAVRQALLTLPHDAVVTLGDDGAYGHRDHLAVTTAVRALAGPRCVEAAFPRGLFAPVHRALRKLGAPVEGRAPWGVRRDQVAWVLPLDAATRARKEAALRAHASQLTHGDPHSFLRRGLVRPLLEEEWWTGEEPTLRALRAHVEG